MKIRAGEKIKQFSGNLGSAENADNLFIPSSPFVTKIEIKPCYLKKTTTKDWRAKAARDTSAAGDGRCDLIKENADGGGRSSGFKPAWNKFSRKRGQGRSRRPEGESFLQREMRKAI